MEKPIKNSKLVLKYRNDGISTRGETYDPSELTEILSIMQNDEITKLISIPAYTTRDLMRLEGDDRNLKGFMPIGYIADINVEEEKIIFVIFSTFVDRINAMKDPVAVFRVLLDKRNNYLQQIISINIVPSDMKTIDA